MSKLLNQIRDAKRFLADNHVSVYYDHDITSMLWEDFKDLYGGYMHVFQSRNGADFIIFGDLERPQFKVSHLKAMSKYDLSELHDRVFGHWQGDMSKAELIEELLEVTTLDFYAKHYDSRTWHNLDSTYTLAGYSQGDAVKVLVLDTMPKELPAPSKDYLHHLLFDSPIQISVIFKGEDLNTEGLLEDFLYDPYRYDKEQVLNTVVDIFSDREDSWELLEFLDAMLPTEPAQPEQ